MIRVEGRHLSRRSSGSVRPRLPSHSVPGGWGPCSLLSGSGIRQTWWSALLFILLALWYINPEFRHYGDAFSPLIPQDQWFLHLYQWGPDGCGTELCR